MRPWLVRLALNPVSWKLAAVLALLVLDILLESGLSHVLRAHLWELVIILKDS